MSSFKVYANITDSPDGEGFAHVSCPDHFPMCATANPDHPVGAKALAAWITRHGVAEHPGQSVELLGYRPLIERIRQHLPHRIKPWAVVHVALKSFGKWRLDCCTCHEPWEARGIDQAADWILAHLARSHPGAEELITGLHVDEMTAEMARQRASKQAKPHTEGDTPSVNTPQPDTRDGHEHAARIAEALETAVAALQVLTEALPPVVERLRASFADIGQETAKLIKDLNGEKNDG